VKAATNRFDHLAAPVDRDPGAQGRFEGRPRAPGTTAAPRWLKLGLAAVLGVAAGTMLFPTEAQGRGRARRLP
jgi:hypothetical protein